ncbi:glycosyltransferase family 9 protein [bacterium]|nr:glycosyltransferase family 9 protein [bacterium]
MDEQIFLVVNLSCFGDVLLTNSLCQNLKLVYPNSKVVFCVDKPFEEAAKYQKDVDDVIVFDKKGKDKGFINLLKYAFNCKYRNKIDASFVIYGNSRGLILSKLLGAKRIVAGSAKKTFLINTPQPNYSGVPQKRSNELLSEVITGKKSLDLPIKYFVDNDENFKSEFYKENAITICFEANNETKDMPIDTAVEIIQKLNEDGKTIYFVGAGISASDYANQLRMNDCNFIDLSNKTTINDLAKVLKMTKGLISIDTGVMHLACALNVPVLSVFFNTSIMERWVPSKELYKTDVVFENVTAENIVNKFYNLVKYE